MEYIISHLPLYFEGALLGLFIGVLTGVFGAGGGFIITPALNIFLGLPYEFAIGTSACQVLGASGFSLYHNKGTRFGGIRVAVFIAIGVPLGTYLGARSVDFLGALPTLSFAGKVFEGRETQTFYFSAIFLLLLSSITSWLFFDNFYLRRHKDNDDDHKGYLACIKIPPVKQFDSIPNNQFSVPLLILIGGFVGFLGGLLGIGGGVIMMPILFYVIGQETRFATLTSTMLIFVSGFFSTITYAMKGKINYPLALFLLLGAFWGARIGVSVQKRLDGKAIRKYFAFVVLAAVIMVLVKLIVMFIKAPYSS